MDLACDFPIKINVTDANLCGFYIMMHAFHMCLKLIMNCNRLNIWSEYVKINFGYKITLKLKRAFVFFKKWKNYFFKVKTKGVKRGRWQILTEETTLNPPSVQVLPM